MFAEVAGGARLNEVAGPVGSTTEYRNGMVDMHSYTRNAAVSAGHTLKRLAFSYCIGSFNRRKLHPAGRSPSRSRGLVKLRIICAVLSAVCEVRFLMTSAIGFVVTRRAQLFGKYIGFSTVIANSHASLLSGLVCTLPERFPRLLDNSDRKNARVA